MLAGSKGGLFSKFKSEIRRQRDFQWTCHLNIKSSRSVLIVSSLQQTWPIMSAGYKFWPAVSLICFTLVPVERRTLVGSLVGFGWGVYLALRASE